MSTDRSFLHRLRRDQGGSAAAGVGFALFGTIMMAAIVLTATSSIRTASFGGTDMQMSEAADERFNDFREKFAASAAAPSTAEICYLDLDSCASITSVITAGASTVVTLKATRKTSSRTLLQRRTIGTPAISYIVGYDAAGAAVWSAPAAISARNNVTTLSGSGTAGAGNGTAAYATFNGPSGVAVDASGNVYVADTVNSKIRKVAINGDVSNFGTGTFSSPRGVALDAAGNLYVADTGSHTIKKVTPAGVVTVVAGSGAPGFSEGSGTSAKFNAPSGVAVDAAGNLFVADTGNHRIRKITVGGVASTFAGNGSPGADDGSSATFNAPKAVVFGPNGNLFVADSANNKIRKVDTAGAVTTFAGTGIAGAGDGPGAAAQFNGPSSVAVTATGTVYVADTGGNTVRAISAAGAVSTFAGKATAGAVNGVGVAAQFKAPAGVGVDASGALYVADTGNNKVRKIN